MIVFLFEKECENSDLAMCIALNKCDLEYSPELLQEAEDLAAEWGCELIKNSAKENINSEYIFEHIVRELRKPEGQRGTWPWKYALMVADFFFFLC